MDLSSLECELTEIRPDLIKAICFPVSDGLQGIFARETPVFHHIIVILPLLPKNLPPTYQKWSWSAIAEHYDLKIKPNKQTISDQTKKCKTHQYVWRKKTSSENLARPALWVDKVATCVTTLAKRLIKNFLFVLPTGCEHYSTIAVRCQSEI